MIAVPAGKVLAPVARLQAWLAVRGSQPGPLLCQIDPQGWMTQEAMSDRSTARLSGNMRRWQGSIPRRSPDHSLRAGFLTEASRAGAAIAKMQEVSRRKKVEVLLGYVRSAELFDNHADEGFL